MTGMLWLAFAAGGCGQREAGPPQADAPAPPPQRIARGRQLLDQYQCGSCHAIPGVPAAVGDFGPALGAFGLRSYIAGHLPNGPAMLARWIEEPGALVPGTPMPSLGVSAPEAHDMAAYLLSLR